MTSHPKLNELQRMLLSEAASRRRRNVFPVHDSITDKTDAIVKACHSLLRRKLVREVGVTSQLSAWRGQGERLIGLRLTDAGRAAIQRDIASPSEPAPSALDRPAAARDALPSAKSAAVLSLLLREEGATIADLVAVTGWLPHTTRVALTRLRKSGRSILKNRLGEVSCYRISEAS